ncbi:hypothetical protein NMG60_11026569 [Bertholletia excelsa]
MQPSLQSRAIVEWAKRFLTQIRAGSPRAPTNSPCLAVRRAVHASAYDKNVDDQIHPSVVPDDVIQPESEKYWAPHPQTGVFGPATEQNPATSGERGFQSYPSGGEDSVLEQKAFFRPQEDLEKPVEELETPTKP